MWERPLKHWRIICRSSRRLCSIDVCVSNHATNGASSGGRTIGSFILGSPLKRLLYFSCRELLLFTRSLWFQEYTRPWDLSCPANGIIPDGFSPRVCTFPWWVYPLGGRTNTLCQGKSRRMLHSESVTFHLAYVSLLMWVMRL